MKPSLENLESRLVPAKITMLNSTTMMVDARQDTVPLVVKAESNNVLVVNGQKVNTINVLQLNVQGSNYNDNINLDGVNKYNLVSNTHNGNDLVVGTNRNDVIASGNGNDKVWGNLGNDQLFGENDNDQLFGGSGDDLLDGGDGNDLLMGDYGNDVLWGRNGNDTIYGNSGSDKLIGGSGYDYLYGDDNINQDEVDYIWTGEYNQNDPYYYNNTIGSLKNKNNYFRYKLPDDFLNLVTRNTPY